MEIYKKRNREHPMGRGGRFPIGAVPLVGSFASSQDDPRHHSRAFISGRGRPLLPHLQGRGEHPHRR